MAPSPSSTHSPTTPPATSLRFLARASSSTLMSTATSEPPALANMGWLCCPVELGEPNWPEPVGELYCPEPVGELNWPEAPGEANWPDCDTDCLKMPLWPPAAMFAVRRPSSTSSMVW